MSFLFAASHHPIFHILWGRVSLMIPLVLRVFLRMCACWNLRLRSSRAPRAAACLAILALSGIVVHCARRCLSTSSTACASGTSRCLSKLAPTPTFGTARRRISRASTCPLARPIARGWNKQQCAQLGRWVFPRDHQGGLGVAPRAVPRRPERSSRTSDAAPPRCPGRGRACGGRRRRLHPGGRQPRHRNAAPPDASQQVENLEAPRGTPSRSASGLARRLRHRRASRCGRRTSSASASPSKHIHTSNLAGWPSRTLTWRRRRASSRASRARVISRTRSGPRPSPWLTLEGSSVWFL